MRAPTGVVEAGYRAIVRPLLFGSPRSDPEKVHDRMIAGLARFSRSPMVVNALNAVAGNEGSPVTVAGVRFPSRVGLAAGMDKNGVAALAWRSLGFGFAELGTVTAIAQPGNDKPRVFRLPESRALINRMGFNNNGAQALHHELSLLGIYRGNGVAGIPLGISIGKSKVVPVADAIDDYLTSLRWVAPHADYVAINVSSPNTPGLRSLQDGGALGELLDALLAANAARSRRIPVSAGIARAVRAPVPLFVKIAPDLTEPQMDEVLDAATRSGVSGVIATNTTLARDGIAAAEASVGEQTGGLSGAPLTKRARAVVEYVTSHTDLPVIASGGIMTAADAQAMFDLGASLVQLYTGFIYAGPALAARIAASRLSTSNTNTGRSPS